MSAVDGRRGPFRRNQADRDLQEELRLHLELAADDARRCGDSVGWPCWTNRSAIQRVSSRRCGGCRSFDANQPIFNVRTLEENYRMRAVVIFNAVISLIGAMGTMGLALAIVGLYGLVAYAASRRTKEIGIRMGLRQGMVLAVGGLGAGLVAGLGASRALTAIFPGGPAGDGRTDVMAFALVAAGVLTVTILAAYVPARGASRINPTEALRCE